MSENKGSKVIKEKTLEDKARANIENLTKNNTTVQMRAKRDMNEMVSVISIVNSSLIYSSKSEQGLRIEWGGFLEENWVEYKELINMRNSQRSFFEQPWVICDYEVLKDLRVEQYYKNIIDLENLDDIFSKNPKDLEVTLMVVPIGIRQLIVDRAFELIRKKELDSIRTIELIEKTYNIDLSV